MARTHIEREEKFEGGGQGTLPELRDLPGVARVVNASPEELDALYYDTADLVLLGGRCTLRRRTGGHDAGWHLKTPERGAARREVQVPLDAAGQGEPPEELLRWVRARTRGRTLTPVAHLHTRRERMLLLDAEDRTLAEVARDEVSAQVLDVDHLGAHQDARRTVSPADGHGGSGGGGGGGGTSTRMTAWSETEVELGRGDGKLLAAVGKRLRSAGMKPAEVSSKLEHALADAGLAPTDSKRPPEPAKGTAAAALLARLRTQTAVLVDADAGVRADEPDAVHRMRIAARRLKATLQSYRRLFLPGRTQRLEQELAWLRELLGEARDHEVRAARLRSAADVLHNDLRMAALDRDPSDKLTAHASHAYRQAWHGIVRELDGPRYFALLDALDAWTAEPPFSPKAGKKAAGQLDKGTRREHRKLSARMDTALALPPGCERDKALHSARKAAKRLRYAAETARPVVGKPAKRLAKRAKAVQGVLGDHQDAVEARTALTALVDQAHGDRRDTFVYGLLYAHLLTEADRRAREASAAWKALSSRRRSRLR